MRTAGWIHVFGMILCSLLIATDARAQSYGVELHNSLMPASGGMGGASLTRPQDLQSAINANPSTLTQFHGTQFSFGGAWAEATYDLGYDGSVPALMRWGCRHSTPNREPQVRHWAISASRRISVRWGCPPR